MLKYHTWNVPTKLLMIFGFVDGFHRPSQSSHCLSAHVDTILTIAHSSSHRAPLETIDFTSTASLHFSRNVFFFFFFFDLTPNRVDSARTSHLFDAAINCTTRCRHPIERTSCRSLTTGIFRSSHARWQADRCEEASQGGSSRWRLARICTRVVASQ